MKIDNKQIARAVFFTLHKEQQFEAASRLAAAMLRGNKIFFEDLPIDNQISTAFLMFGCSLKHNADLPYFNCRGTSDIDPCVWFGKCRRIYSEF